MCEVGVVLNGNGHVVLIELIVKATKTQATLEGMKFKEKPSSVRMGL